MRTAGKIIDATVIVGSVFVGIGAVKGISQGVKLKSTGTIVLGGITLLIGIYAFREAMNKINE
jgi:hypothetical protein